MAGPLDGIRVVDLTTVVLGPIATQMLGDAGADVIKVETPAGDMTRFIGPGRSPDQSAYFANLNRNKRSLVLDLKRPEARAALLRLIDTADVFVHNTRAGAAARLGLDPETLLARHPRLIHASASGYRLGSSKAEDPAYDDIIQGMCGLASLNGEANGTDGPRYVPSVMADKISGHTLTTAITMALFARERAVRSSATQPAPVDVEHLDGRFGRAIEQRLHVVHDREQRRDHVGGVGLEVLFEVGGFDLSEISFERAVVARAEFVERGSQRRLRRTIDEHEGPRAARERHADAVRGDPRELRKKPLVAIARQRPLRRDGLAGVEHADDPKLEALRLRGGEDRDLRHARGVAPDLRNLRRGDDQRAVRDGGERVQDLPSVLRCDGDRKSVV